MDGHYVKWSKPGPETHEFSYVEDSSNRESYTQKQAWPFTNSDVEHVCNSGTTQWNSGKEGKNENDRARVISHNIDMKVEYTSMYTENCWRGWKGKG
jgi:hypothetical protein